MAYDTCGHLLTASNRALTFLSRRNLNLRGEVCPNDPLFIGKFFHQHNTLTRINKYQLIDV